jgi:YVTN family beta-propeller protein
MMRSAAVIVVATVAVYFAAPGSAADVDLESPVAPPPDIRPAGKLLLDAGTRLPAAAPLTMNFVRTPDTDGPDGKGRYLVAINSGFGLLFNSKSKAQQTISVIDLTLSPEPQVVQTLYFPSPQSANVGVAFDRNSQPDGTYRLYVAGGNTNKIWILAFDPKAPQPLTPGNGPDRPLEAPSMDVTAFAEHAPSPEYNDNVAPVYPTGLAISPRGDTIYSANNLGDTLGMISDIRGSRRITRIGLHRAGSAQFLYPYDVKLITRGNEVAKAYVSLWGDASVAVVRPNNATRPSHIGVDRHPTMMLINRSQTRLYVVNSDADTVSVIDTATDRVIERINVRLTESELNGASPEGLALSEDERTLYVANARANAVGVITLSTSPRVAASKLRGFIPVGNYPSAVAVAGGRIFVANGKGTGVENSSLRINESGLYPNMPNKDFPGAGYNRRGMYSVAAVTGNISVVGQPGETELYAYTQTVMKNNGLLGREKRNIFPGGRSPFKHVMYVIRENRTYDQVFGDLASSGDGSRADGDASVAIFGAGEAARSPGGKPQNVTPNVRALARRFGLFDRFFVNAEASPDGHNWSTAAFSSDYIDKAFRWDYSGRGRTYDYEGFNRLPSYNPPANQPPVALPPVFDLPASGEDIARFMKRYVPYLNGGRDIGEPESLYLWDAAKRVGLTYRNYGEFVATVSQADIDEVNTRRPKTYPDVSRTVTAFPSKKSLEGNFSPQLRNFDMSTPDIMTVDSYRMARTSAAVDAAVSDGNADQRFRGSSRFGDWQKEFRGYVADLQAGRGDTLPNLSIVRLPNDHTSGVRRNTPTPQFYVAENDYALGRLVEEVSKSAYWKDTAIFVVEDDAQDGPDHVDAHRSPVLVISAYNRPGALIHEMHNTVSLIRTIELCLGMQPMNFLDAHATPMDVFGAAADLRPYLSEMPEIDLDNLYPPERPSAAMTEYMRLTARQDLRHADMADPREMNEIIWFSVRGKTPMPAIARLPAFELMIAGIEPDKDDDDDKENEADE